MHGRTSGSPYKLAHSLTEVPSTVYQVGGWVVEVYGTDGLGVLIQTTPKPTIQEALLEADRCINNNPSLKGYHL